MAGVLNNWRVWLSCLPGYILVFCVGMILNFSSPAFPDINSGHYGFKLSEQMTSWLSSCIHLFAIPGCIFTALLMDKYGRKYTILANLIPQMLGWFLVVSSFNVLTLAVARAVNGFAIGMALSSVYVYTSEIASKETRGILNIFDPICLESGCLLVNLLGSFITWKWIALTALFLTSIAAVASLFMYETPRWLISQGHHQIAIEIMGKLWCGNKNETDSQSIEREIISIQNNIKLVSSLSFFKSLSHLMRAPLRKPFLITLLLFVFQQFTGIAYIDAYAVSIFTKAAANLTITVPVFQNPYYQSSILSTANLLGNVISIIFVERSGRRTLLLVSGIIQTVSLAVFGAFYYIQLADNDVAGQYLFWLPLLCLMTFSFGYCFGFGSVPFFLISELIPLQVRSVANSVGMIDGCLCAFVVTKVFPIINSVSFYATFWIYASVGLLSVVVVFIAVPETKGRSLEDIQERLYFAGEKIINYG